MNARQKFRKGDRVCLSKEGRAELGIRNADRLGTVVGFGREFYLVRVLRDGAKTPECYAGRFWDVDVLLTWAEREKSGVTKKIRAQR